MKLKQRVVVTGTLFLGMTLFFLVGIFLGSSREDAGTATLGGNRRRTDPLGIQDHGVSKEQVVARYNRSRDVPSHGRRSHELQGEGKETNRRLQQKLDLKSSDEVEKQPRETEFEKKKEEQEEEEEEAVERGLDRVNGVSDDRFRLPHEVVDEGEGEGGRREGEGEDGEREGGRREGEGEDGEREGGRREGEGEDGEREGGSDPWKIWQSWVKQDHFYPEDAFWSEEMNSILRAMATYPISSFDVGHRGTQLKASMFLGNQRTAFKPMRQVEHTLTVLL